MTTHDDMRLSLGSYLTGGLGPTARAKIDEHLHHCDACRAELVDLAALPGLLARLGPGQLGAQQLDHGLSAPIPSASNPVGALFAEPPDGLLNGLLAQARRIEEESRRRFRRVWAAAAVFAIVAVVATAFAVAPILAPAPGTSYRLHADVASTRPAGRVTLISKPWGTELALSLQGLPARQDCEVVVTGVHGQRATIGNWSATPDHVARVEVASAMSPSRLVSITVQTVAGTPLLDATLTRPGS